MLTQAARRFSTTVRASLRASLMEEQVTKTRRNGVGIVVWKHIVMEIRGRKRWITKNTEKRREHRQERARKETACPLTIRPPLQTGARHLKSWCSVALKKDGLR